jgi:hypothetical protein
MRQYDIHPDCRRTDIVVTAEKARPEPHLVRRGMGCTRRSERLGVLADCVRKDMCCLKVIHRGSGLCGGSENGNDGVIRHLFLLKLRVVRLDAGNHCFLLPQDHSFLVALRDLKSPDVDFFFQNKAALDDDGLFHHRKYGRIAFLPNGRYGFDLTANRYSIDLHPFVIQRFIDEALMLARDGAHLQSIACRLSPRDRQLFGMERNTWLPCGR